MPPWAVLQLHTPWSIFHTIDLKILQTAIVYKDQKGPQMHQPSFDKILPFHPQCLSGVFQVELMNSLMNQYDMVSTFLMILVILLWMCPSVPMSLKMWFPERNTRFNMRMSHLQAKGCHLLFSGHSASLHEAKSCVSIFWQMCLSTVDSYGAYDLQKHPTIY